MSGTIRQEIDRAIRLRQADALHTARHVLMCRTATPDNLRTAIIALHRWGDDVDAMRAEMIGAALRRQMRQQCEACA